MQRDAKAKANAKEGCKGSMQRQVIRRMQMDAKDAQDSRYRNVGSARQVPQICRYVNGPSTPKQKKLFGLKRNIEINVRRAIKESNPGEQFRREFLESIPGEQSRRGIPESDPWRAILGEINILQKGPDTSR